MTKEEKKQYEGPELLRDILQRTLKGMKFRLDCGHHVTGMPPVATSPSITERSLKSCVRSAAIKTIIFIKKGERPCVMIFLTILMGWTGKIG